HVQVAARSGRPRTVAIADQGKPPAIGRQGRICDSPQRKINEHLALSRGQARRSFLRGGSLWAASAATGISALATERARSKASGKGGTACVVFSSMAAPRTWK